MPRRPSDFSPGVRAFEHSQEMSLRDAIGEGGVEDLLYRTALRGECHEKKRVVLYKNMRKQKTNKGKKVATKRRCR